MRFAVIGTPRSGNSLLRRVLSHAYGLHEAASHDPDFLLGELPDDTVYQVHAPYGPEIAASLHRQRVIVVTPQRHPIDTLLSMLHFAQFEPDVSHWLGGDYLVDLPGCDPTSRAFREFALGDGAAELLAVSVGWSTHAHAAIRYGQLAEDPLTILAHEGLGPYRIVGGEAQIRAAASFEGFRSTGNMHGWMGRAGYWRGFVPEELAEAIRERHAAAFAAGSFGIDGAKELSPQEIRVAWAAAFSGEPAVATGSLAGRWSRVRARLLAGSAIVAGLALSEAQEVVPIAALAERLG